MKFANWHFVDSKTLSQVSRERQRDFFEMSRNRVGKYVDRTSRCRGFVTVLDRIRATWSSIYGFFDPLEIPGAFTELRKVRFGARKSHMCVYDSDWYRKIWKQTNRETWLNLTGSSKLINNTLDPLCVVSVVCINCTVFIWTRLNFWCSKKKTTKRLRSRKYLFHLWDTQAMLKLNSLFLY